MSRLSQCGPGSGVFGALALLCVPSVALAQSAASEVLPEVLSTVPPATQSAAPAGVDTDRAVDAAPDQDHGQPPLPTSPAAPWGQDHRWRSAGLSLPVSSVAMTARQTRLALLPDGTVFRAAPGGAWRQVLGAPGTSDVQTSADEDVLLESEATVDELLDAPELDSSTSRSSDSFDMPDDGSVDLSETEIDLAGDVTTQVSDNLDDMDQVVLDVADGLQDAPAAGAGLAVGKIWAQGGPDGVVLAGRQDGLWLSEDDGRDWRRVSPAVSVGSVLETDDGTLLAGGSGGLGVSHDGGAHWRRVNGTLSDYSVLSLAQTDEVMLAGTNSGLFMSLDAQRWTPVASSHRSGLVVWDILVDPNWNGGLWLATSQGILRSDDLGQTLRQAGRNPLLGTVDLMALPQAGQLLAVGSSGPWESVDGGLTWTPLASGLSGPEFTQLTMSGPTILMAGELGVMQLGRAPKQLPAPVGSRRARVGEPALYQVVGQALERPGLDLDALTVNGKLIAAQLAPRLQVKLKHKVTRYRQTLYDSLYTTQARYPTTDIEARLCWGACASLDASTDIGSTDSAGYTTGDLQASDVTELAVVDGQIYDLADSGALSSAAANVAQRATGYRTDLARLVSDTWLSRRRLLTQDARVASLPLNEQVSHVLLLQELTARLDLYTDGWFSHSLPSLADAQ